MPDDHITDEQIHEASGRAPRMPPGVPKATCLRCGQEYVSFYASQAHDCRIELRERKSYAEWLVFLQQLGMGVLKNADAKKFPWDRVITGRQMLTFHLQSDLFIGPGYELKDEYYHTGSFEAEGFPASDGSRSAGQPA